MWARKMGKVLLFCLIKLIILTASTSANEVLGCGGFIKSNADIDFSMVEIKLLTKQGSLKDKTDCSPSNGYYFLPIYDKGEYLLRISPPPGWSFEPQQVVLNFDGRTDLCSQGKDVNFVFKGFGITGKVALAGHGAAGARGVDVELRSEDGTDMRRTTTDLNGVFSFTPIIPGRYLLKASHPRWHFSKAEHTVDVVSGNTELPENTLVVSGFDVLGRFETNGQQLPGIDVAIFRRKGQTLSLKCHRAAPLPLTVDNANYEPSSACYTAIEKSGSYSFAGVPPGKYLLQAVVQDPSLKLHISPNYIEIEVGKDTLELKDVFKITGLSVSGKVQTAAQNGGPLSGATVKLNGQKVAETAADGSYMLNNIKAGAYKLLVEAPKLQFREQQIQLQLATAKIPDIVPSGYQVCGKVVSKQSHTVGITQHGSTFHTTTSSNADTGEWCTFLPVGKFVVEVLTSDADKANAIKFFPVNQHIDVKFESLNVASFSQLRATLRGEVKCLPDAPKACTAAEVTLHALDATGQPTGHTESALVENGFYTFRAMVKPGPYEITIPQSSLCFESTRVLINVASATETAPPFIQRGYELSIISSHRAIANIEYISSSESQLPPYKETLKLSSGVNTFCVQKHGTYSVKLSSCHLYDDNVPKTLTTGATTPVVLTASAHKIGVLVLATEPEVDSFQLSVEAESLGKKLVLPIAESIKVDGKYAFRYDTYLKPDEVLRITPQSDTLLFSPQSKELVGGNDCVDIAFNFIATRGLILRGKVMPPIKDVKITLSFPKQVELAAQSTLTSVTGEFKFGPIDGSMEYELHAEKNSYVFSDYNRQSASFSAHKLCEIIVKVKDDSGKALNGVLLSLSGGESYRKNLITGENGAINFHSLSPSQYFLRPMMKEYKFEPNSKMIDIKDGETVEVDLVGKRVAYSAFGTVTSLNGDPFAQVNIEATADEQCQHHQEEATSENTGQYRLRGLQPGCKYTIRAKDAGQPNSNVERSIPATRTIQVAHDDVRDVNLVAISPINFVDVTARVTATSNDHYKTLRLVVYRKGASDSPIYSQRIESPLNTKARFNPGIMVYLPRIPLDGKTYFAELRSSLSDQTYTYTVPIQQFTATTSSIFLELDFKPEVRTTEADLNQNSISALVLVALVAIAFFKQDIAMDFLNFVWSRVNSVAQDIAQKQRNNAKKDVRKTEPINQKEIEQMAEQINATKKKKTKKI